METRQKSPDHKRLSRRIPLCIATAFFGFTLATADVSASSYQTAEVATQKGNPVLIATLGGLMGLEAYLGFMWIIETGWPKLKKSMKPSYPPLPKHIQDQINAAKTAAHGASPPPSSTSLPPPPSSGATDSGPLKVPFNPGDDEYRAPFPSPPPGTFRP